MRKNKLVPWVLVFWPETEEISIKCVSDIEKAVKNKFIKKNCKGELPWIDADGITTLYEAKFLRIARKY